MSNEKKGTSVFQVHYISWHFEGKCYSDIYVETDNESLLAKHLRRAKSRGYTAWCTKDGAFHPMKGAMRPLKEIPDNSEVAIYKAQAREDSLALSEGREPRLITTLLDIPR